MASDSRPRTPHLPEQPHLNWSNPAVVDAMLGVARFWLDRGVDGFRLDVPHCIGKDMTFADCPPALREHRQSIPTDPPETHEPLRRIRALVDSYPGDRTTIGEVNLLTSAQ